MNNLFGILDLFLLVSHVVASGNFTFRYGERRGQSYDSVTFEIATPSLASCAMECVTQTPPCYAFNYRESEESCQLVLNGKSDLVESDGCIAFVRWMCLTEHPTIPNAEVSYEDWNGEYPAPKEATVVLQCDNPKGFSDGSPLHKSRCSSAEADVWSSSFQQDAVHCEPLHVYPDCRLTEEGREYIGTETRTESGKTCLRWDTQPHGKPEDFLVTVEYDDHFLNRDAWSQHNYCRNPSRKERPWCFVADADVKWEYCDIPLCTDTVPPEYKMTQQGGEYIGRKNVTLSGVPCRPWKSTAAQLAGLPDADHVDERHNFCRNPSGDAAPWCYTEKSGAGKEYCDVPFRDGRGVGEGTGSYPECRLSEKGKEYVGTEDVTETGKPCLFWSNRIPPEYKMTQQGGEYIGRKNVTLSGVPCRPWKSTAAQLAGLPDADHVDERHNFCRNPSGDAAPWCYTEKSGAGKEYCDVPFRDGRGVGEGTGSYPECRLSEKGKEYVGTEDVTETGKPCLFWSNRSRDVPWDFSRRDEQNYHLNFLNGNSSIHENHCRNPGLYRERPWCFVSDPDIRWEYCNIPFCRDPKPPECKLTERGGEYVGRRNATVSGLPCSPWLSGSVVQKTETVNETLSAFSDEVDGSHNYCRFPEPSDGKHGPYCHSLSGTRRVWEHCDVPFCPKSDGERCDVRVSGDCVEPLECKMSKMGSDYRGTKNVTKSGLPCQPWLKNSPNDMVDTFASRNLKFPDDLYPSHNFCRNPDTDPDGPWCYNGSGTSPRYQNCDIPLC
ncbi:unnamed protein product [Darwinula stevensoni]|uniref:Kringle domain-containing protein n=1 Tax=Darwinula stevensoni TaxID=69355 RepID=A0A7R9FQM4_9CRUS|nr:unnamed protein product [Darwinula stevensoni]CAG0900009.1 unnamed protein product [Darwinula stevensoni]